MWNQRVANLPTTYPETSLGALMEISSRMKMPAMLSHSTERKAHSGNRASGTHSLSSIHTMTARTSIHMLGMLSWLERTAKELAEADSRSK